LNLRESYRVEPNKDRSIPLSWEQARRIADILGISVSEFVRSGLEKMMRESHPALPQDLVRLYYNILDGIEAELWPTGLTACGSWQFTNSNN
jgi:hypothetical protein